MPDQNAVESLMRQVRANPKYQHITDALVWRLSEDAISKGLKPKAAVKIVRNKLHQVGGAYFKHKLDYQEKQIVISHLPPDLQDEAARQFCLSLMQSHASSAERIPILDRFFRTCLEPILPVRNVLDLACGFNPFAIPWMPLSEDITYQACDIFLDMLGLIQTFFTHFNINGGCFPCDLAHQAPAQKAQVAFLLKSIPCLEQVDKTIGIHLLESIRSEHILVSFPVSSLAGRRKGMPEFYRDHFHQMISGTGWLVLEFNFQSELAFLVTK